MARFPSDTLKDTTTMTLRRTRARTAVRLLITGALLTAALGLLGPSPASAWCNPGPSSSGLLSWGEESSRGSTCDRDNYYAGQVRDSPTVADGYCAHVQINSGGGWFTQAYACSSSWVSYSVSNATAYATKLCRGATTVCANGSYSGA